MKHFLTTTATALILGTSAFADGHAMVFSDMTFDAETNVNASELIGARVYATESDIENTVTIDGSKEWDDIGEINEIVLTRDGDVQSVIVGVGGFLGLGEKDVAIDMSQLKFVNEEGELGYFLVISADTAGVQEAPAYERSVGLSDANMTDADTEAAALEDADTTDADMAQTDMAETDMADADSADMSDATDTAMRPLLTQPMVERDGFSVAMTEDLNTEDLTGARVYGPGDEDVGEISELLLSADGKLDRAVIDVGGFLGLGERPVAVTMDELQIMRSDDGDEFRVYIDASQDALEQQPEYEG